MSSRDDPEAGPGAEDRLKAPRPRGRAGAPAIAQAFTLGTALANVADVVGELGLDARAMGERLGIPRSAFDNPRARVRVAAIDRLLTECAALSGCDDIGLRIAARRRLSNWGDLALVLRPQPTLQAVIDKLCRYIALQTEAARLDAVLDGDRVELRFQADPPFAANRRIHGMEMLVGILFRNLCEIMGAGWTPPEAAFRHLAPRVPHAHAAFFTGGVGFQQPFDGLRIRAADLPLQPPGADPQLASHAEAQAAALLEDRPQTLADRVTALAVVLLPDGDCSRERVAAQLGVTVRTLQRRLAEEDATFADLLNAARDRLVRRHLEQSNEPLSRVAGLLGFSSQPAFNQWFRARYGVRPLDRRRSAR